MHQSRNIIKNIESNEWFIQSENWISELAKLQKPRKLRERNPNPLILSGHGNLMRIDKGTLLIKEGFTHYPQKPIEHRYFKGDLELPKTIMLLDGSGSLSFDVLSWLSEQSVSLIRIKWNGDVAMVLSNNGYCADQSKVDWQRETHIDPVQQIAFSQKLISAKLQNSLATLRRFVPQSQYRDKAIDRTLLGIEELSEKLTHMKQVRTVEAQCASAYFRSWTQLQFQWKPNSKYPIPDDWRTYFGRSSVLTGPKAHKYNASHPLNAMLNYAYTVKTAQLKIEAIAKGYDPQLGIMHHGRRDKPAYIFDLIEPERPKVDAAILEFMQSQELSPADFILTKNGTCRLSPGLAKIVAALMCEFKIDMQDK